MSSRQLIPWCLAGLFATAFAASAQRSARIQGTVTDSIHAKPAAAAPVLLTRLSPEPTEFRSAITDEKGRFHFDTLVAGHYAITFATPYLDSLHLIMPDRELRVAEGQTVQIDFATPSGATLRAAACPDLQPEQGKGALLGKVTDADTDQPLSSARVAVSWTELTVDSALHPVTTARGAMVAVDSLGRYHLCGVPTNTWLLVQVQNSDRAGSVLTMTVDAGGVLVRDLSLSSTAARSLASLDSAAAAAAHHDTTTPSLLTGTATLAGTVRSTSGQPLSRAQVRIRDARVLDYTDSLGHFTLTNQPAGSQLLEVRRVGYLLGQVPVELRSGRRVETTVTLARIVSLDSIRIVAHRSAYTDFERRRTEGFGRFLDEKEIEQQHPMETSDLFRDRLPGFSVEGSGDSAKVFTTHGRFELSGALGPCKVNVVIDGLFQHQDVNLVDPATIGAVEAYPGPAGAPIQYDRACGVIVIWTKRQAVR
jgi:hypothetical protein